MAKALADQLRASGVRKRVAKQLETATKSARGGGKEAKKALQASVEELRTALNQVEDRAAGGPAKRKAAAKKASATRKRNAAKRSAAAKKAARTRAKA